MKREQLEQILLDVQKPAQYIGGELNSVMKDKSKVDCRLAFCFPDKYEVGMSHLGMKILYSLYNLRENWWCERVFAPDADMEQLMREKIFRFMVWKVWTRSKILILCCLPYSTR